METNLQVQPPTAEQLSLFDPSVVPCDPEKRRAVAQSTGYWIRHKEPELAEYVVRARAAGMSFRQIRAKTGLALATIGGLLRNAESLDTHKETLARTMYLASTLATERMVDEIDSLPHQSLPIVAGAMAQRAMELQAGGQVHIHRDERPPEYKEVAELYSSLPGGDVLDAEEISGFGAGEADAKRLSGPSVSGPQETETAITDPAAGRVETARSS